MMSVTGARGLPDVATQANNDDTANQSLLFAGRGRLGEIELSVKSQSMRVWASKNPDRARHQVVTSIGRPTMSSISANPFALLSGADSDDEGQTPKVAVTKPTQAASSAPAPAQVKKNAPAQQPRRDRGDYPARGAPRKVYGANAGRGGEIEVIGDKPAGLTDNGRDDRAERRGGGGRGRGASRGRGGRGRGGARFDERPDRHSASGTHDTDRKIASGWGAEEGKEELQAETDGWGDAKAALTPTQAEGWGEANAAVDSAAPVTNGHPTDTQDEERKEQEEEDKTKTFEEYLAEKANSTNTLIGLKQDLRKPNEGVDDGQWKNAVKLVKAEEEEEVFFQGNNNAKEKKAVGQGTKKNKEKTYIEVEPMGYRPPRFASERGSGRGRGGGRGRGDRENGDRREFNDNRGGRGGRGRGGARGHGPKELNTEDANAFPSLS
ncbi:hypothetical protein O181_036695 [Austropuccinia psidii MF-1]|uniref:Hyaluronan/mRNA-binding protein domain-containing protein n=1 Tax=Austropuccinia psidii MF-1 TaxID=1389203 RepID=A0A9Q3D6Y8_9BASI|nr:hypothetical protein [Austropuccinia psidii MF-1]